MNHFWLIWAVSMVCGLSFIPLKYKEISTWVSLLKAVYPGRRILSPRVVLIMITLQLWVMLGIATFFGLQVAGDVGLHIWLLEHWREGVPIPFSMSSFWVVSILSGVGVSFLIQIVDHQIFQPKIRRRGNQEESPLYARLLASFYGGVCEEVLMRLGLMTVIVFLAQFIGLKEASHWAGIGISTIFFAAGHLPVNFMEYGKSPPVIARTLLLNSMVGLLFGWLYWQYGLESAMISHFTVDLMLHVFMKRAAG